MLSEFTKNPIELSNSILIAIASIIAIWLGIRKIRISVTAIYTISSSTYGNTRISKIALYNKKDNHVPIREIYVIVNGEIIITLYSATEPTTISPYDVLNIETEDFSDIRIDGHPFRPDYSIENTTIALNTGSCIVKCKPPKQRSSIRRYKKASIEKHVFNGIMLTEKVDYIVDYIDQGETKQAVISGRLIYGDPPRGYNFLPKEPSDDSVISFFKSFEEECGPFACHRVHYPKTVQIHPKQQHHYK
ncbi:hypothetical protein [Salinicola halophilus]|uniref:hypothetical protein n=1 Tax=Salinicola halophilus TaxID=184065 RepID=UPI0013A626C9|nr:hypothetical protein [Salinicola halophilus]